MKVHTFPISGPKLIEPTVYPDPRGFFSETYSEHRFRELGLPVTWVQDNRSRSVPRVLRGLHSQHSPWQQKLVQVVSGRIYDVAVDMRPLSPTFGKYQGVELSATKPQLFFIPEGFAHGFMVVGDEPAEVIYKVNAPFKPEAELGLLWSDPDLGITWPHADPIVSEKDQKLSRLRDLTPILRGLFS